MKETKILRILRVLIFNVAEIIVIFLLGEFLKVEINVRVMLLVLFFLTRMIIGKPKHYKKAYKCAIWSALVFLSLYSLSSLDFIVIILLTIFTGFISTGRADIDDMFMWKGKASKYEALKDLISLSPNNTVILEHEEYWRKNYPMRYEIFQLFYRENMSYSKIMESKEFLSDTIIKNECKTIYSTLERPLNLPPIE